MKFCPKCGKEVLDDAIVCFECGNQFGSVQQPAQAASQPAPQAIPQQHQGYAQPMNQGYAQPMNPGYAQPNRPPVYPAYGQPMYQNPAPVKPQESQGIAIAALVCAFFFWPAGLILGIMGLKKYEKGSSSKTMSIAAAIISGVYGALVVLGFAFCFLIALTGMY